MKAKSKVTTNFEFVKNIPVVKALFTTGESYYLIVDTGASITIWNKAFVDTHRQLFDIQRDLSASSVTGATSKSDAFPTFNATAKIGLQISKESVLSCDITGLIMDIKHISENLEVEIAGLIGSDYLQSSEAIVNFKNNKLTFHNDLCSKQHD